MFGSSLQQQSKLPIRENMPSPFFQFLYSKYKEAQQQNPNIKAHEFFKGAIAEWDSGSVKFPDFNKTLEKFPQLDQLKAQPKPSLQNQLSFQEDSSFKPITRLKNYSPFAIFANEHRENIRKENPKILLTQLSKLLAEMWDRLGNEGQKPYVERYEKEKSELEKALKEGKEG